MGGSSIMEKGCQSSVYSLRKGIGFRRPREVPAPVRGPRHVVHSVASPRSGERHRHSSLAREREAASATFYSRYGFVPFEAHPQRLFLTINHVRATLAAEPR